MQVEYKKTPPRVILERREESRGGSLKDDSGVGLSLMLNLMTLPSARAAFFQRYPRMSFASCSSMLISRLVMSLENSSAAAYWFR